MELEGLKLKDKVHVDGGAFFVPLMASVLAPVIADLIRGKGMTSKQVEKKLKGSGAFGDFVKGFVKDLARKGIEIAKDAAVKKGTQVLGTVAERLAKRVGLGKGAGCCVGGMDRLVKPRKGSAVKSAGVCSGKRAARNEVVRCVMKEQSLSLPAASAYVKKHQIPY